MRRLLLLFIALSWAFSLFAQESTYIHFWGYLAHRGAAGRIEAVPYTLVTLSRRGQPERVVAATVASEYGEFAFEGVPVDPTQEYIFTVYAQEQPLSFIKEACPDYRSKYKEGVHRSCHILLPGPGASYTRLDCLAASPGKSGTVLSLLKSLPELVVEDDDLFLKSTGGGVQIHFNREADLVAPIGEWFKMLGMLPLTLCDELTLVVLSKPTGIYDAVLNIRVHDKGAKFPDFMQQVEGHELKSYIKD